MSRRPNIPNETKRDLLEQLQNDNIGFGFIELVVNRVSQYKNMKQTCELLAEIASLQQIKDCNAEDFRQIDFSEDARKLVCSIGCKDEYTDPDLYSLRLYMLWARFLKEKKIIDDYRILFENNAFVLEGSYDYDKKRIKLGTDGISIRLIKKYAYDKQLYKSLGSFLIWPRYSGFTINGKKGLVLKDDWGEMLEKVVAYYSRGDTSFFTNSIDIEWMDYIGNLKKEKDKFKSFCICYELEDVVIEENGMISYESIVKRNNKMWNLILKK